MDPLGFDIVKKSLLGSESITIAIGNKYSNKYI